MCSADSRIDRDDLASDDLASDEMPLDDNAWKQKVSRSFAGARDSYEEHTHPQRCVAESIANWMEELMPAGSIRNGLEIGCGTGHLTREILERFADAAWTITDLAPDLLDHCRLHPFTQPWIRDSTRFQVLDGEHPRTGSMVSNSFDLIVSNMTFQWFTDLPAAIPGIIDLLVPDGWLIFSIPAPNNFALVIKQYPSLRSRFNERNLADRLRTELRDLEIQGEIELLTADHAVNMRYRDLGQFLTSFKQIGANTLRQPGAGNLSKLRNALRRSAKSSTGLLADYRTSLFAIRRLRGVQD